MSNANQPFPVPPASSEPMVVNCVAYSNTGRRVREVPLDDISDVIATKDHFVWVGLHEPDEQLLRKIQEEFEIHDLAIEDAQHAHQRPKIEVYDEMIFIVLHTAQFVGGVIEFGETHIFLGCHFLITVRHGASLSYAPARVRCEQTPHLLSQGPSFGLYAVMDFIVDNYFPIVRSFEDELKDLEKSLFEDQFNRETIHRLYTLKRELVTLRLAVAPLQDITNQLIRFHPELIPDEVRNYFRDVFDHAIRISETTTTMAEMLSAALQVNLSMVTVGQNEVVKRLASWAGLLAIPTLFASIYGMNFANMPELHWHYGYPIMLGVTASVTGLVYWQLKKAGWL
jgi:magnesium transporter